MNSSGRLVLALDYPGRRDESRIRDLDLESAGWNVRYLLTAPFPQALTSAAYAHCLLRDDEVAGTDIAAVLAYCSGAPIAQQLVATRLRRPDPVPLLLFDGEPSLLAGIRRDALAAASQIGATDGARPASPADSFTDQQVCHDPQSCISQLRRWLVGLSVATLRSDGADESEARSTAADIADFYLDWFVFLIAAHNTSSPAFDGRLMHAVSRVHPFTGAWPGSRSVELYRIDSGRNELLAHRAARSAALSFLDRVAAGPTAGRRAELGMDAAR
jgi:hypothetical protein